jgi:hypothetical protein
LRETGWTIEPCWTLWSGEKCLDHAGNASPAVPPVAIPASVSEKSSLRDKVKRLLAMENEVNTNAEQDLGKSELTKIIISSATHTVSLRTRLPEYKLPKEDRYVPVTYR